MREYKRKTEQKPLSQALYDQAVSLMNKGVSLRQAAKSIGFSHTALSKRLQIGNGGSQLGRFRPTFTSAEENELYRHCVELDKRFFGLSLKSLRYLLYTYAKKNGISCPFSDVTKLAGRDFTRNFLKRKKLSLRTARKTSVARVMGFNRHQLFTYFDTLEETLNKYRFGPEQIYNMDETGVQTVPNKLPKHIAPTGKKEVAKSVSAEQGKTVTVVLAMSAVGHFVPPFFIYARKRENRLLIKGGPIGCDMALTEKGYMNTTTFVKWLAHFKKYAKPTLENPLLLTLDNHISHISLIAVDYARANNIYLLTLPPHSSHKTQPLDRCFFRPFKSYYDAAADSWINSKPGQTISEYEVAELVKIAFERTATVEIAVQSFRSTGIHPCDRNVFTDDDFLPSEVTEQELETDNIDNDECVFIEFNQNRTNDSPPQQDVLPQISDEPTVDDIVEDPSFSGDSVPTSPADIIPLPKIKIKRKRTGRSLKSVLITSSPHKKHLEEKEKEKTEKERIKLLRKDKKLQKALFPIDQPKPKKKRTASTSSDTDSYSVHNSSSDMDGVFSWPEDEEDEEENQQNEDNHSTGNLQLNDFAVVKVQGKTKKSGRLYVSKILHIFKDGYNVIFYKNVPNTRRFLVTDEEAFVERSDIHIKLSEPIQSTSGRFKNTVYFNNELKDLIIY